MNLDISSLQNLSFALNSTLGSTLIIVLILMSYLPHYNPDHFQRNIFSSLLVFYLIAVISDFFFLSFQGIHGEFIRSLLYVLIFFHFLFQMFCYYQIAVFIDYMAFKEKYRSNRMILFSIAVFSIYAIILLLGCKYEFFIIIDSDNIFHNGNYFYFQYIIGSFPMVFVFGELLLYQALFKRSHFSIFIILLAFICISSILDLLFPITRLAWPWETAALLYAYFFIVQSYVRIDPLTDIGNRLSFNEFTNVLSRNNSGDSWAIVMLDMDHFKMINDTLGHQEGDRALCDMASILKNCVKGNDFVARYGGDEFVLTIKIEKGVLDKVSALMNEIQIVVEQFNAKKIRPFKLEISYGYDVYTADGKQSMEEFLNHIDSLMYKHKQEHRRSSDTKEGATG
jgi:diguanylate cyclase (GGDEF)-like protein